MMKKLTAGLGVGILLLTLQVFFGSTANATIVRWCNVVRGTEIQAQGVMGAGECIRSSNGAYDVRMQMDGNLVLYRNSDNHACWAESWETGGRYVAGNKMYFHTLTVGLETDSSVIVANSVGAMFPSYKVTYGDMATPGVSRNYSASINNSGQFWVGYDLHRKC